MLEALAGLRKHVEPAVGRDIAVTLFQIDLVASER